MKRRVITTKIWQQWQILGVVLLAAVLLFHNLAADSLWGDEIFTAIFAAKSPAETIAFTASDIHPPLYYLLAGSFSQTSLWPRGTPGFVTDWLWRWPSALAGLLAVAVTYRLGLTWGKRRTGLLAALLLAVAPVAVKYGQEARMHALFMTLSAAGTLWLALALKTNRRKYWIGYALTTLLTLYTMYFAFIIIAVHAAWIMAEIFSNSFPPGRARLHPSGLAGPGFTLRPFINWLIAIAIAFTAYLPWWPVLIKILTFRANVGAVEGGVGSPWAFLPKVIEAIGPFGGSAWLFLGLYLVGLWAAWRHNRALTILGAGWLLLPMLLPIFLGDSRALHLRYAFVLPLYLIFVVVGLEKLSEVIRPVGQKWVIAAGVSALVLLNVAGVLTIYRQRKPDWRGAAALVSSLAGPGDVVVAGPLWDDERFFGYYYPLPERLMSPPLLVSRLPGIAAEMAEMGGRLWLITRHTPQMKGFVPHELYGVTVLAQPQPNYDPVAITRYGAELCKQAARSADEWAAAMEAGGVLNPDPRASRAGAYRCQGDVYAVIGDFEAAVKPYQKMVEAFPGWAGGYATLAKTYLAVDNLPAAAAAFEQAVRFNPAWQGPAAAEAARLAAKHQWAEAVAVYETIVD